MNQTRVLIIDDEKAIQEVLRLHLKSEAYETDEAKTGIEGLEKIKNFHPHLIILDLGLPDRNGLEILKDIRAWSKVPVIVLTVNDDEKVKVKLLDSGADDYLTKPFSPAELMARVRVALRHYERVEATPLFQSDDLKVDLNLRKVEVDQQEIKLTKTEFELLQRLVREAGKVVPQNKLLKEIWGSLAQEESHYLRIYIKQLRKKIEKNPSEPVHILTEPGVGYRIV
jgi:two-component system, OmpR family, KDP operon response regulator KdpE